ncbi:hypothetical protein [Flavobacterium okayamense]|uniref:Uncharacterized protein n=1 Tax=Flavobacterium okayamense TaxID=2830782 RepID=A0ABM7S3X0_9FLAO|nr:hypothetical protein [Flavobacterium okayamense]BCY28161.1 hypothetical protein KK2020170_10290 [Flavobacterium okayamense]
MHNLENREKNIEYRKSRYLRRVLLLFSFFYSLYSSSQCAMCRAALESEESTAQAEGINNGIIFLMVLPYILVAIAGFAIYKIKYGKKKDY